MLTYYNNYMMLRDPNLHEALKNSCFQEKLLMFINTIQEADPNLHHFTANS